MNPDFSELWRRRCLAYKPLRDIVGNRVYPAHISGISGAEFPSVSLFTMASPSRLGVVNGMYQMDSWAYSDEEARVIQDHLYALWAPENLDALPSGAGVEVLFISLKDRVDVGYEKEERLFHKCSIYGVRWRLG